MWKYYVFTRLFHFTFLTFIFRHVCWLYFYLQYPTWGFKKTYLQLFLFSFKFNFGRAKIYWHYIFYKCSIWLVKISVHRNSYLQNRTTSVHNTQPYLLSNFIYSFILSEAITNICTCPKFWTTCTFHFVPVLTFCGVTGSILKTYLYK